MARHSYEIKVQGIVQGVGFRPFIYRLALEAGLPGNVSNTGKGVSIILICAPDELAIFIDSLKKNHPPLACISSLEWAKRPTNRNITDFSIHKSANVSKIDTLIPQDSAICHDCLGELSDKTDRRYNYPFINCTNCGPRFSIIESLPYDRPNTSMKSFSLCKQCATEYNDPGNRRFHAQPIGCWSCGPSLSWHDAHGKKIETNEHILAAREALGQGKVVAIKGLGGFNLAVDATNPKAISQLRKRKRRKSKPLAIMVRDLKTAHHFAKINKEEVELLCSSKAPIVLLKKKAANNLPDTLAPSVAEFGIMLPYTPLHHLLFTQKLTALVMTSGNIGGEPICIANDEALQRLNGIADFFLLHNRKIVTRLDDSILRFTAGKTRLLRRSRGYVPEAIRLKKDMGELLTCGASKKNTFCLTRGKNAFLGQYIGDLNSPTSLDFYKESLVHLQKIYGIVPKNVFYDLHPDYISSRFAKSLQLPGSKIQHHHAHAAAVIGEHGIEGPVICVIFDGTGLGPDQTIWGGEILYVNDNSYRRLGYIDHLLLPGGDGAVKRPWKMALALLWKIRRHSPLTEEVIARHLSAIPGAKINLLLQMLKKDINCPTTSSCGRLFDGIAAFVNQRMVMEYEGQAAMELEALAWQAVGSQVLSDVIRETKGYLSVILTKNTLKILDIDSLIKAILADKETGVSKEIIALKFHLWLITTVVEILRTIRKKFGQLPIILSGGCMQNSLLLEGLCSLLNDNNFAVFGGEKIPMNDGGISFGQAVIGGKTNVSSHTHAGN